MTGEYETGLEAVQDGFADAIRSRTTFRGDSLEGWVWRTVLNASMKARRRQAVGRVPRERGDVGNGRLGDLSEVRAAIVLLPERQRLIVFLRYFADLDYEAIAKVLGVRVGTVSAALHAAHTTLRLRLEEVRP